MIKIPLTSSITDVLIAAFTLKYRMKNNNATIVPFLGNIEVQYKRPIWHINLISFIENYFHFVIYVELVIHCSFISWIF